MGSHVTEASGVIVICGRLQASKYSEKNRKSVGTYDIITENDEWHDPTGQKAAQRIRWRAFAQGSQALLADPTSPARKGFDGYLIIEAIPKPSPDRTGDLLWRERRGRPRKTIYLDALFVTSAFDSEIETLGNSINVYPKGSYYPHPWREEYTPEPIIDDYEFMYEDERWSRDPD